VVVDNRAGAGGMIGAEAAAAMPPDGYNLFYTVKGVMAIAPHLYPNAKYNPLRDFKAVTEVLIVPHIITATPNAPYNTMAEMVAYAKANPGKINYASAGVGSQPHVALEAWARRLGIKLTHIPYKTNPSPDVMSGVVNMYLEASTTAIPSIQGKRIKALAVSGAERVPALPDVPTMTEFNPELDPNGVIGNSWHTFFAPAGTPDDIVARLNTELVKIVKTPEIQARLRSLGLTPTGTPAATVNAGMAQDHAYWGRLIKELDIRVE
jgi:tripartite-type tricarboxylate transporter receptor subunit TctC